jgi:hypothetical protein
LRYHVVYSVSDAEEVLKDWGALRGVSKAVTRTEAA